MELKARIPVRGLAIALSGAALGLPSAAAAASNGGAPAPGSGGMPGVGSGFTLAPAGTPFVGRNVRIAGIDPNAAGRTVSVQVRQRRSGWTRVATALADGAGDFSAVWRPTSLGRFQIRGVVAGTAHASAANSSAPETVFVYKPAIATWYGPGFYGRRTACGERLTRRLLGVASRRLRCGTRVRLSFGGRSIVVRVVDRGPFAHRAQWDLTGATATALGMTQTSTIGAAPLTSSLRPPAL